MKLDEEILRDLMQNELFISAWETYNNPISKEIQNKMSVELSKEVGILFSKSLQLYEKSKKDEDNCKTIPYKVILDRTKKNNADYFYNLLHMGIQNGIAAVQYNLQTFVEYSDWLRMKGKELIITSPSFSQGSTLALPTQKLTFEYEHFTLHSRIVIDRLNHFLNYYFLTDSRNLYKLYNILESNANSYDEPLKIMAIRVKEIIDNHRDFLDELITHNHSERKTERDILAHREEIQFTTFNLSKIGEDIKVFFFTHDHDFSIEADSVLTERFNKLQGFIIDLLNCFFDFDSFTYYGL